MLSTDSEKIINIAKKMNFFAPFIRPSRLAGENSRIIDVILHSIKWLKKKKIFNYKYLLLLQATSPLRTAKHIDNAIKNYSGIFIEAQNDNQSIDSLAAPYEVSALPYVYNSVSFIEVTISNGSTIVISSLNNLNLIIYRPICRSTN